MNIDNLTAATIYKSRLDSIEKVRKQLLFNKKVCITIHDVSFSEPSINNVIEILQLGKDEIELVQQFLEAEIADILLEIEKL